MNPAEFANIARSERDFWWYRGMRAILFRLLDRTSQAANFRAFSKPAAAPAIFLACCSKNATGPSSPWTSVATACATPARWAWSAPCRPTPELPFADSVLRPRVVHRCAAAPAPPRELDAAERIGARAAPGGLLAIRTSALDILRSRHSDFAFERQRFTRAPPHGLATASGIRVLRCTYANSLLFPIALAKFRIWEPLLRAPAVQRHRAGRAMARPRALQAAWTSKPRWIGAGRNFPVGQSLLLIGEKRCEVSVPQRLLPRLQRRPFASPAGAKNLRRAARTTSRITK